MCDLYSGIIQNRKESGEWENIGEFEFPTDKMPLCGCWLFDLDFNNKEWEKIKDAHESAGNGDKFEKTKNDTIELNNQVRDLIFKHLAGLSYNQRLIIEKIA